MLRSRYKATPLGAQFCWKLISFVAGELVTALDRCQSRGQVGCGIADLLEAIADPDVDLSISLLGNVQRGLG